MYINLKSSTLFDFSLIYFLFTLFSSCQTENKEVVLPDELDNQLAYIQRFPEDTLKNYEILKKSIITSIELKNEDLTYKLILYAIKKYPGIVQDKEVLQLTIYFYGTYLNQEETALWIEGITNGTWNESKKIIYFNQYVDKIIKKFPEENALHFCEQLVNMAKIHSLLFPLNENSPLFLWKSFEIMKWIGSKSEAKNVLDLILIRHKTWHRIKEVKREREWLILEKNKKNQAPVS
jgi:hypothetical protein